jgi:hypothetical protein
MRGELVIASIDRAADHAAVVGVLLAGVAIGGLAYGLFRLAAKARTVRTDRRRRRDT